MLENSRLIKRIFDPYFEVPIEIWDSFAGFLKRDTYKKNEVIKEVNQKEKYLSFIAQGSGGYFSLERKFCHLP